MLPQVLWAILANVQIQGRSPGNLWFIAKSDRSMGNQGPTTCHCRLKWGQNSVRDWTPNLWSLHSLRSVTEFNGVAGPPAGVGELVGVGETFGNATTSYRRDIVLYFIWNFIRKCSPSQKITVPPAMLTRGCSSESPRRHNCSDLHL